MTDEGRLEKLKKVSGVLRKKNLKIRKMREKFSGVGLDNREGGKDRRGGKDNF